MKRPHGSDMSRSILCLVITALTAGWDLSGSAQLIGRAAHPESRSQSQPIHVVINEILPDPQAPLATEWVELYCIADREIDLDGWSLCDAVGCSRIGPARIAAGCYLILCKDDFAFREYYLSDDIELVVPTGWRALNNTGDVVYLTDRTGLVTDSIQYKKGAGNNFTLERIDPHEIGYDMSNWYKSTSPSGSTPGRVNSVREGFSEQFRIELDSRLISPDGDDVDPFLTIRYDIPRESKLSLRVFDLHGRLVKTICEGEYLSSGTYEYDGSRDDGGGLGIGLYVLLAELSGSADATRKLAFAVVGRK